jgi:tetratricopeptide (TPR) repeat protein
MPERLSVMISSTSRDLPAHREAVMHACLRQGMFPLMMEHLPASDDDAIRASMKLVDQAHLYLGIFAHRYGYVPAGHDVSITEMELNRAAQRQIPRLIFLVHDDHPVKRGDREPVRTNRPKLKALKERLKTERVVNFFTSPDHLGALVVNGLSHHARRDLGAFHHVLDVPALPEPYLAHRYTLLRVQKLVGREDELAVLERWVSDATAVLSVVAIGGMGKSALAWKWFQEDAPRQMPGLRGRMWWSFYESDARFENFLVRAVAYVSGRPIQQVQELTFEEQGQLLFDCLDREPFLLVLDGLERVLLAYARLDAARLADEHLDAKTAHVVPGQVSAGAGTITAQHRLRETADARAGALLRKLTGVRASRLLITTRLHPLALQQDALSLWPGCQVLDLTGLTPRDAVRLWKARGGKEPRGGALSGLLRTFAVCDNHPLVIQALVSAVAMERSARGDFEAWWKRHPDFDPFKMELKQSKSEILAVALAGLAERPWKVLQLIAAFRMPTTYATLAAVLVGDDRACPDEAALDETLTELEGRGLLGWDQDAGRYDLHPVVRGVTWDRLGAEGRRDNFEILHRHFAALPVSDDESESLDNLTPALELFNTLIGLERYDDAHRLFFDRLATPMLRSLNLHRQRAELLEALFPRGKEQPPVLAQRSAQAQALNALSLAYRLSGRPGLAADLSRHHVLMAERSEDVAAPAGRGSGPPRSGHPALVDRESLLSRGLRNLASALCQTGKLLEAENAARRALLVGRQAADRFRDYWEAIDLGWLATVTMRCGRVAEAERCLRRGLKILAHHNKPLSQGRFLLYGAQLALWQGNVTDAEALRARGQEMVLRAMLDRDLIDAGSPERDLLLAVRLDGELALARGDPARADDPLHQALREARRMNLIEEELPALVGLAEMRRQQGRLKEAETLLESVWDWVQWGPYPLLGADAQLVLCHIRQDAGDRAGAAEAARKAYESAWCDGPSHAYHWGLKAAEAQLVAQRIAPPGRPSAAALPCVDVEIDPADGFFGGQGPLRDVLQTVGP